MAIIPQGPNSERCPQTRFGQNEAPLAIDRIYMPVFYYFQRELLSLGQRGVNDICSTVRKEEALSLECACRQDFGDDC